MRAAATARAGEVVLLSPGCTSYDMFADFTERGDAFVRVVEAVVAA
jgi:UDP-N-acetylmuramoylalanine--D-glutamate ligase